MWHRQEVLKGKGLILTAAARSTASIYSRENCNASAGGGDGGDGGGGSACFSKYLRQSRQQNQQIQRGKPPTHRRFPVYLSRLEATWPWSPCYKGPLLQVAFQ